MEEKRTMLLEGLLPVDVWNAIVVILILFGVFVALFKGIILIRDEIRKHRREREVNRTGVTDEIADKVIEKLTPQIDKKFDEFSATVDEKFRDIDKKLAQDNEKITLHTSQLNAQELRVNQLDNDSKALCHGVFALLSHEVNGNSIDKLQKAQEAMKNYLIDGNYNEEAWR